MGGIVLRLYVSSLKRVRLETGNNVAQISPDNALNTLAFELPRDVKNELIAFGPPSPGQYWITQVFFIESLDKRTIGLQRRDSANIDTAAG